MSIKSLETLEAWKKAKEFALRIYREILPLLPSEEKWNLNQQLRRASGSIPANIAEGYGRFYYQEIIRFCYIARGSLEETLSHLALCYELKYIAQPLFDSIEQDGEKLTQLINGYIGYLKRSKQGQNEPGQIILSVKTLPLMKLTLPKNPLTLNNNSRLPTPDSQ